MGETDNLASVWIVGRKADEDLLSLKDANDGVTETSFDVRGDDSTILKPNSIEQFGANLDDTAAVLFARHTYLSSSFLPSPSGPRDLSLGFPNVMFVCVMRSHPVL